MSMRCLDLVFQNLCSVLDPYKAGLRRENVAHVSHALFCPCLACKGVCKVHERNGTFVVVAQEGGVLYARCADSSCYCSEEEASSGWMDVVCAKTGRPWIRLTPESLAEFESKTARPDYRKRPRQETLVDDLEEDRGT